MDERVTLVQESDTKREREDERYKERKKESSFYERTNAKDRKSYGEMERRRNHRLPHFADVTKHNGDRATGKTKRDERCETKS